MSAPTEIKEYAFSGSLCRISKFETLDGERYCLRIFSLSDYKHLHFPHDVYKWIINKLYAFQCMYAIMPTVYSSDVLPIQLTPFDEDFKIQIGFQSIKIGPVTAIGLVKTTPFTDVDVFSVNEKQFTCDSKWDICTCRTCPAFKRLIEYEATALERFSQRKPENVILFELPHKS